MAQLKNLFLGRQFALTRLWRFLNIYFLKPNDAVNDTITASLLTDFDWSGNVLEIGSGDGMFSYVMHGGGFPINFDRYRMTDLKKADIYDVHQKSILTTSKKLFSPIIEVAIDAKRAHVDKIREINFAKNVVQCAYEKLPFGDNHFDKLFVYTPHGLEDFDDLMDEATRVLMPGGSLFILVYDSAFQRAFLCKWLSKKLPGKLSDYFKLLDNNRYEELTGMSKSRVEWESDFFSRGLSIEKCLSGLNHFGWMLYDIQTRPLLRPLIKFFSKMPMGLRTMTKLIWMLIMFPYVVTCFYLTSNFKPYHSKENCYVAYHLKKT